MIAVATDVDLSQFGPLIAVLAAMGTLLKIFLAYLDKLDERHEENLKTQRVDFIDSLKESQTRHLDSIKDSQDRQEKFLGNHMSTVTKSLENVSEALKELRNSIENSNKE